MKKNNLTQPPTVALGELVTVVNYSLDAALRSGPIHCNTVWVKTDKTENEDIARIIRNNMIMNYGNGGGVTVHRYFESTWNGQSYINE